MKGKIFIAWSGDAQLATEVKRLLEKNDFEGIVGGAERNFSGLFVGEAVLKEIDQCNQAVFVVQKKNDGSISNNLMFEFGYSLSKFTANKIHIFYVDISPNDNQIPSDINGIWAHLINTSDSVDIPQKIVEKFLQSQKHIVPKEKIRIVDSYYAIKNTIQCYAESPQCSEYELAQYILFFSQAAYLFDNEKESLECLHNLSASLYNPGIEVSLAKSFAVCSIEFFLNVKKNGDTLYIEKDVYRTLDRKLRNIIEAVLNLQEDDFSRWFLVMLYDIMNYSRVLFASNPEISEERHKRYLEESLDIAKKCIVLCDRLLSCPTNQNFCELFKAYMYRNMASAQRMLNVDTELVKNNFEEAYKMRRILWDHYNEGKQINSKLLEFFEMEYFLALSEKLEFIEDPIDYEDSCDECGEYIERVKTYNLEKSHFVDKIECNMNIRKE